MANNILSTVELIEQANAILSKHSGYLKDAATSLNSYVNSAKLPSNYVNGLKSIDDYQKKIVKSTKDLEREQKKMQRERIADLKLQKKREQAFDKYEKQLEREQRLLNRTQGLYNKVQRGVNSVTRQYQDLAIKKELNGKLTAQETVQLGMLEGKLNKYQAALKRVDANIGKHQRNVGNYKSGYDGLGMSIAQLSREMPAFANSMQTGFMAISNNIPMFVDEIDRLKRANVDLAASGKPTVNILKRVGKGIISMNGLLGVGITLLTVFGPKLIDWAFGMSEAEKATEAATKEIEEQNKSLQKNIALRNQQISGLKNFMNDPELNKLFTGILSEGETKDAGLALIELSERLQKIGVDNAELLKDTNITQRDRLTIAANILEIDTQRGLLDKERSRIDAVTLEKAKIEKRFADGEINARQQGYELRKLGSLSLNETIRLQSRINQLEETNNGLVKRRVELNMQDKGNDKESRRELEKTVNTLKRLSKTYEDLTIDQKTGAEEIEEYAKALERARKMMLKLQKQTESYLSVFSDSFIKSSPLGSLATFFDGTFDALMVGADTSAERFAVAFNAIAESAQQAFEFIDTLGQQNFEAEFARLEQQREFAILFAGESTTARADLENEYERKRAKLQRKQAEAQKDSAIFNIGIDTAQAIVSTLAKTPPPAGLPLAALMAALGAAQLVAVKSAQIPAFWQGGEVGGMQQIMVNDDPFGRKGANYKEVIEKPNGQLLTPQGRNVKMTVPKGSFVHSTYDNFINSLDNELLHNNIMPIGASNIMPMIINNGLTKDEVMDVMNQHGKSVVNAINSKEALYFNYDERGAQIRRKKQGRITKIMNARYSGKGIGV